MNVSFTVHGLPAPQGSKAPHGGEANPRTRPWRAAVTAEAARAMNNQPLITGPVHVHARFGYPRPKNHYRTGKHSAELRPDAPAYMGTGPDLDKLQRAIGDALTGVVIRDDRQISSWSARKEWRAAASAEITVTELDWLDIGR